MFSDNLATVYQYLDFSCAKKVIQINLISSLLLILFIKKSKERVQFCIDYKKLNAITKKDFYLIHYIQKRLSQHKDAKYFHKMGICKAFYQIKKSKNEEKLTIFLTKFDTLKTLQMIFCFYYSLAFWPDLINVTLFHILYSFSLAYLDNILICSKILQDDYFYISNIL